jgi:CRP-like cAMP-binding protein
MARAVTTPDSRNRLLAALPADEFERIRPLLHQVPLEQHTRLELPGSLPTQVYFPWSGVCSLTVTMGDGRMTEVATIGNEGLVGMSAYFGSQMPDALTLVQVPGDGAHAMRVGTFVAEMEREGPLYHLVRRYSQALIALMMQSVGCNALHELDQRCARWLLMTDDCVGGADFALTQEFLSYMLVTRRSSVSIAAGRLQRDGLIQYRRGVVRVLDRAGLEAASCECYAITRSSQDQVFE